MHAKFWDLWLSRIGRGVRGLALKGLDALFEVSDSIEDLIYRQALELVKVDWLAAAIAKAIMLIFPLPRYWNFG